jgi:glycosyltransferase involved in cell wall biosynthesis
MEIRAQFLPERFAQIGPPPAFLGTILRIMFIGRVNRIKGVLDILEIARRLEQTRPGRVHWEICGTGPDFDEMKSLRDGLGLTNVDLLGWVSMETLQQVYNRNHISIIPTRSDFAEGLAMTAAEAILAKRPIITNPTVPAFELLEPAALAVRTNDVQSYVTLIERLLDHPETYKTLCDHCVPLQAQFYDRAHGLTHVLERAISQIA